VWRWSGGARSLIAVLTGLLLLLHTDSLEARLALIVCIGLACADEEGRVGALFSGAALGWRLLLQGCAWAWRLEVEFSRLLSRWVGGATGQLLDLGPSASGLDLFILFLLLSIAARSRSGSLSLKRLGIAAVGCCLFMALVPSLAVTATGVPFDGYGLFNRANEHLAPAPQAVARLMFGWSAALLAGLCLLLPAARRARRPSGGGAGRGGFAAAIVMTAFMTGTMLQTERPPAPRRAGAVVLLKSAAFDMNVPSPGRFGSAQAGMLGMLPRYLALDGHRVRVHQGEVTDETLWNASVTIVALPESPYKPAERRALERYVRRGGSLLVLGDHTDLLGTMGPLNALTAGWGITFQFDSAFASQREWAGCLDAARPLWRRNTGIGTGASLRIGAGARPMIIGRFGLADAGDRSNGGRGANLGDYAYQPG
ncbi:MAG TPA: hypothetical protein VE258_05045, partial [Ktedonobacterales bacterium]|nr:hypothetical protein [Ktedonobacterales bacterium]